MPDETPAPRFRCRVEATNLYYENPPDPGPVFTVCPEGKRGDRVWEGELPESQIAHFEVDQPMHIRVTRLDESGRPVRATREK